MSSGGIAFYWRFEQIGGPGFLPEHIYQLLVSLGFHQPLDVWKISHLINCLLLCGKGWGPVYQNNLSIFSRTDELEFLYHTSMYFESLPWREYSITSEVVGQCADHNRLFLLSGSSNFQMASINASGYKLTYALVMFHGFASKVINFYMIN